MTYQHSPTPGTTPSIFGTSMADREVAKAPATISHQHQVESFRLGAITTLAGRVQDATTALTIIGREAMRRDLGHPILK